MKTNIHYSSYEELSVKQWVQLLNLCREFQPYTHFEDVVFLEVITAAREYCSFGRCLFRKDDERFDDLLMGKLKQIKAKYYFNGIKPNKSELTNRQINYMNKYIPRVIIPFFEPLEGYRPVEKVLFLKIVRACRDFMMAKMSKDAEPAFKEKLDVVYNAMAN